MSHSKYYLHVPQMDFSSASSLEPAKQSKNPQDLVGRTAQSPQLHPRRVVGLCPGSQLPVPDPQLLRASPALHPQLCTPNSASPAPHPHLCTPISALASLHPRPSIPSPPSPSLHPHLAGASSAALGPGGFPGELLNGAGKQEPHKTTL